MFPSPCISEYHISRFILRLCFVSVYTRVRRKKMEGSTAFLGAATLLFVITVMASSAPLPRWDSPRDGQQWNPSPPPPPEHNRPPARYNPPQQAWSPATPKASFMSRVLYETVKSAVITTNWFTPALCYNELCLVEISFKMTIRICIVRLIMFGSV